MVAVVGRVEDQIHIQLPQPTTNDLMVLIDLAAIMEAVVAWRNEVDNHYT